MEQLTLFAEAAHAKTYRAPAKEKASPALSRGCGSKCSGSCSRCDPLGCSLRTYLLSELEGLTSCSLVWKRQATPSGRPWWVLGRSGRRTGETECGLWPTARANDAEKRGAISANPRNGLPAAVLHWPTPQAHDCQAGDPKRVGRFGTAAGGRNLTDEVMLWPTPTAGDANSSGAAGYSTASGRHPGTTLTDATCGPRGPGSRSTDGRSRARLNHRWVAQLLGYPPTWCDVLEPTADSRQRRAALRALGNSIVPQVASIFLRWIAEHHRSL